MSITFVAAGTAATNSTAGTTNSPGIPAGLTNNSSVMYMFVAINGDKTGSLNTPSGWTKLGANANGTSQTLVVYRKLFATGDTAPSVTWTTNNKNTGIILGYNGVDTTSFEDVAISFNTGTSTAATSPTLTALTRGAMRFHAVAQANNSTSTPDFRMVERSDTTTSATSSAHLAVDDERGMAEGALGTRKSTESGSAAWVAATIWIKPAVADKFGLLQSAQYVSTATNTAHSTAYPNALTSGSTLTAGIATFHGTGATISNVTYGSSVAWSQTSEPDEQGTNLEVVGWHFQNNTDTTAATVNVTVSSAQDCAFFIAEWLGLPTSGTLIDKNGKSAAASGTAVTVSTASATTSGQTDLGVMYASQFSVETNITGDANYIVRWVQPDATHMAFFAQSREFAGGSTETATATLVSTSSEWEATITTYMPAVAATDFPLLPKNVSQSPLYRM